MLVEHGADAAEGVAGDDRVADAQRAALDQDGRDRAAAAVEVSLDRDTLRVLASASARRSSAASAVSRIDSSSCVDVGALLGRHVDEHGLAAVLLGHQAVLGELLADLGRVRRPPCRSC